MSAAAPGHHLDAGSGTTTDGAGDGPGDEVRTRSWWDTAWTLAPYAAVVVSWLALMPFKSWFVNPDGVVYAALADRVAAGDAAGAVTTYWSPLYPLLAAPLVALGLPALAALRGVLLVAALLALPLLRSLARRCGAGRRAADVAVLVAVPLLVTATWFGVYPELLLAVLALALVRSLLAPRDPDGRGTRDAVLAGVWAGLAYLAKAVGLPFAVTVVVLVALARLVRPDRPRRETVRSALVTLGVAALVAGPWIAVVSAQAGHPTISTAGSFNARFAAAGSWGSPLTYDGLYPLGADAVTPWEDPEALPDLRAPEQVGEPVTTGDRVSNTVDQVLVAGGSLLRRWWAVLPVAALGLVVALRRGGGEAATALGLVAAAAVLTGGLSLLVVIERYLWTPLLASVPVAAVGLQALGGRRPRRTTVVACVVTLLVFASLVPVVGLRFAADREVWREADRLEGAARLVGPVAGAQDWQRTQLLAHLAGTGYVGTTGTDEPAEVVAEQMREVGARHLVVWDGQAPPGLPPTTGPVTVYDLGADGFAVHDG